MYDELNPPRMHQETFARFRHRQGQWRGHRRMLHWVPMLIASVVLYLHITAPPPSISRYNYKRIEEGMTEREVERIIGTRPGEYESSEHSGRELEWIGGGEPRCCESSGHSGRYLEQFWSYPVLAVQWSNHYGRLCIGYGMDGRVSYKSLKYDPSVIPEQPELWPSWKRLLVRSVPVKGSVVLFFSPF